MSEEKACRCGWEGQGDHPCHSDGYSCKKPAKERFYYRRQPFGLAGVQMKLVVDQTWACEECWALYQKYLKKEITEEEWIATVRKES